MKGHEIFGEMDVRNNSESSSACHPMPTASENSMLLQYQVSR
jgi:hypothetical protein